nr:MAG TPA: hypothetical protein [Caudoviricetes sp.]
MVFSNHIFKSFKLFLYLFITKIWTKRSHIN